MVYTFRIQTLKLLRKHYQLEGVHCCWNKLLLLVVGITLCNLFLQRIPRKKSNHHNHNSFIIKMENEERKKKKNATQW